MVTPLSLDAEVERILARADGAVQPAPDRSLYLDLAESVVRQAARWQRDDGHVDDPHGSVGEETSTTTGRYAGAVAHLLRAGRCADLLESAMRSLDWCCEQVTAAHREGRAWRGSGFYLKDALVLYQVLAGMRAPHTPPTLGGYGGASPLAPPERFARWTADLASYVPERLYDGGHNWLFYNATAELLRVESGLSDRRDYVDAAITGQMEHWTPWGMYRDPNDPVTYDLTVRQALAMMLEHGYEGTHAPWMREVLRRGALVTLLFVSPTGVAPYGGRSNQFHHMEAMIAYFAEWQAKEEARAGNLRLAGALRRMALAGAEADAPWLLRDPYFPLKNRMAEYPCLGHDAYHASGSLYAVYALLAANLFGGAYHVADPSLPAGASPADVGGALLHLPDAFYRVWATAGPYHIQIDTMGQPGYDATGLGRVHRRGVPVEAGLNMSLVADPHWHLPVAKPPRSVALGAGWPQGGDWRYLAEANRETHSVDVAAHREAGPVEFSITYMSREDGLASAALVSERYHLSAEGLRCAITVPGAPRLRLQVPLPETDGESHGRIELGRGCAASRFAGHTFAVRVPRCLHEATLEPWPAANRNGIYRVAILEVEGPVLEYEATLE